MNSAKTYPIASIFPSIQGEGHFVGYPMVFIRLAGCSVKECHIRVECDTDYKAKATKSVDAILEDVTGMAGPDSIVSLTGGEPTDHDLIPLIDGLKSWHYRVHMETSGKRLLEGYAVDWLTVSPKSHNFLQRTGHTLKIVVKPEMTWQDVYELDQGCSFFHRYLQPLTGEDMKPVNLPQVIAMIKSSNNRGSKWALSTQAHHVWQIP